MTPRISRDLLDRIQIMGSARLALPPETTMRLETVVSAAFDFFRLPIEQKLDAVLPHECGFRGAGIEYSKVPERPDQIESFSVCGRTSNIDHRNAAMAATVLREGMLSAFSDLQVIA